MKKIVKEEKKRKRNTKIKYLATTCSMEEYVNSNDKNSVDHNNCIGNATSFDNIKLSFAIGANGKYV